MTTGRNNRNVRTKRFKDLAEALPSNIQELARAAYSTFLVDPLDPALSNHGLDDTKRGRHRKGSRSVAVSYRYRAIYVVDGDANVCYWIGSHEDYNVYTGRK